MTSKEAIQNALAAMSTGDFLEKSKALLATLGYHSERTLELSGSVDDFIKNFPAPTANTKTEQEFRKNTETVKLVFQFTSDEIPDEPRLIPIETKSFDEGETKSFLFCAVELKENNYSRTKYAAFTREINKRFLIPTVVLFRVANHLTIGFTNRRQSLTNEARDVLEQVTLIKDVHLNTPHRAHIDILSELSLLACVEWMDANNKPKTFDGLLAAWLTKLDIEELNKKFYRELFKWFEWAVEAAKFPTDEPRVLKPEEHVIRLITRLLFIWFLKEKGLVAEELFNKAQIRGILAEDNFETGDSYYRVVLQNLFFATLNTEIDKRGFTSDFLCYCYKTQMRTPDKLLALFAKTPFINGGLFDCLDSEETPDKAGYRIDCFSDDHYTKISIPNRLFLDETRGLLSIFKEYKFTVEENTPIEEEVALDPELLGRVFEHLLAEYNPETRGAAKDARRMTGSYYTPRKIVDYMVEEALVATLSQKCNPTDDDVKLWNEKLHYLFDYAQLFDDASVWFDDRETEDIVKTISELKILDPAVGSGAFPMGVLHKLTLALRRLDPDNTHWEQLQKERARKQANAAFDILNQQEREAELSEISKTFERYRDSDFGRKLYLIQNSIFGVDIQSVACQIAKLRFFISLAIEQEPEQNAPNFGIKPLPNLETRFIAANTLISLKGELTSEKAQRLKRELLANHTRHFPATAHQRKMACKTENKQLRKDFATELKRVGMFTEDAEKIANWDVYDQNAAADWFAPEWMFGITEGFDVVIGNPPYIQLQKESGRLGDLYQKKGFDTFARSSDIYCLFYEKAHKLSKKEGHVCFITSNKWMRARYGKKLRDYFVAQTLPIQLLDMGPGVFDATVDTNILLFQNTVPDTSTAFRAVTLGVGFDKQTDTISQYLTNKGTDMKMPAKGEPWAILSSAELAIKRKIQAIGRPLKDWNINIYMGIKTGCNEAFIIDEAKRQQLIDQDPKSAEIIKPLLRGKDLKRYSMKWKNLWLIYVRKGTEISRYPAILNYLQEYQYTLSRKAGENKWYELQASPSDNMDSCFQQEKILWQEMAKEGKFSIDKDKFYSLDTTRILTCEKLTYLLGILNSKFFLFAFKNYYAGGHLGSTGVRFKSEFMKSFPIPPITEEKKHIATQIEALVEKIIDAKQTKNGGTSDADATTAALENEIDTLVYGLYDLTPEEIRIVEGAVSSQPL